MARSMKASKNMKKNFDLSSIVSIYSHFILMFDRAVFISSFQTACNHFPSAKLTLKSTSIYPQYIVNRHGEYNANYNSTEN